MVNTKFMNIHVPFPNGKINGLHKVTHPLEEAKKGEEPLIPIKLQLLLQVLKMDVQHCFVFCYA